MEHTTDHRIEQLETRSAFMEQTFAELSTTAYQQQQTIDALQKRILELEQKIRATEEAGGSQLIDDPRPPHY